MDVNASGCPAPATVLIVEDHAAWGRFVREMLESQARHVEVLGLANNAEDAVGQVRTRRPGVVLMDLKIYEFADDLESNRKAKHGVAAIRRMRRAHPGVRILAMSQFGPSSQEAVVVSTLHAGIDGYIRKDEQYDLGRLWQPICAVAAGRAYFGDQLAQVMRKHLPEARQSPDAMRLLDLMTDGLDDDAIAQETHWRMDEIARLKREVIDIWRAIPLPDLMERFGRDELIDELL